MYTAPSASGASVAALVLGIAAILLFCFGLLSILAIVFGAIGKMSGKAGGGMAVAGIVLGIISLIPSVTFLIMVDSIF